MIDIHEDLQNYYKYIEWTILKSIGHKCREANKKILYCGYITRTNFFADCFYLNSVIILKANKRGSGNLCYFPDLIMK